MTTYYFPSAWDREEVTAWLFARVPIITRKVWFGIYGLPVAWYCCTQWEMGDRP